METRRLEYFVVLTAEGTFSAAAARLQISQPALSQQIRRLEQEVGAQLIDRSVTPFELTPAGLQLLAHSRKLLVEVERIGALLTDARKGRVGRIRVGIVPSLLYGDIPGAIREFCRRHPQLEIRLARQSTAELIESVRIGQTDVGFLFTRPSLGLSYSELYRDPYVAVLPAVHPLATRESLRLIELRDEEIMMFPRHGAPDAHDALIAACVEAGFSPQHTMSDGTTFTDQVGFVASGLGVSLLPGRLATVQLRDVVYRPVVDPPVYSITTIAWDSGQEDASRDVFIDECRRYVS
jgi:DNA-binding transcriptional LysR family regulator